MTLLKLKLKNHLQLDFKAQHIQAINLTIQPKEGLGITPAGAVSFVSDLYPGRKRDKKATQESKIYSLLENRDSVMADKGFDIEEELPRGVRLDIPPFPRGKDYVSIQAETQTRQMAACKDTCGEGNITHKNTYNTIKYYFPILLNGHISLLNSPFQKSRHCFFPKFYLSVTDFINDVGIMFFPSLSNLSKT